MSFLERLKPIKSEVWGFPGVRYGAAVDHLPTDLSSKPERYQAMDVGGYRDNPILQELVPGIGVVSLNIPREYHRPKRYGDITYDGLKIPVASDAIPIVIGVDVLEQIHPQLRLTWVNEMLRVAKERVIISGPFHTEQNARLEENLLAKMKDKGLKPKRSIEIHRELGLPMLNELVQFGRALRCPFHLYPATLAALDFAGLIAQVATLPKDYQNSPHLVRLAKSIINYYNFQRFVDVLKARSIAKAIDYQLQSGVKPTWQQAYRAVMVIDKSGCGGIITIENELSLTILEKTAYLAALTQAGWEYREDPVAFYTENPLRGRHIAFEGPDGSGKSTVMDYVTQELVNWGYQVAIPKKSGLRQDLRETETRDGRLIDEPSREQHLATATVMAMIDANAFTLRGPCFIGLSERTLASVEVHHKIHGQQRPVTLVLERAPKIPPDLTIVLEIDDPGENFQRMRKNPDLANAQITPEQLAMQRLHYREPQESQYTGPICRIKNNGPIEETVEKVLEEIEKRCGIPTTRSSASAV